MSKQARQGSFTARAPSSVGVSRDLLSALLRREVHLPLLGEGNLPGAHLHPYLAPPSLSHCPRAHLWSSAQQWPFYPLASRISVLFWVSRLPCPACYGSETFCFFKALQQQQFDNLLVLSQVYIKAQQWSNTTYSGCGTDFSFQRCGWFAVFPRHMEDLHRAAL